jgi:prevent-host-death family protein
MSTTTLTSREFHQDSSKVKQAVQEGPVVITDRGKPSLVLMTYQTYEQLKQKPVSLAEALYMPGAEDIELELPERVPYTPQEIDW